MNSFVRIDLDVDIERAVAAVLGSFPNTSDDDVEQIPANLPSPSAFPGNATMPRRTTQLTTLIQDHKDDVQRLLTHHCIVLGQPITAHPSPQVVKERREAVLHLLLFKICLFLDDNPAIHPVPGTRMVSQLSEPHPFDVCRAHLTILVTFGTLRNSILFSETHECKPHWHSP